jgi:hypothetical protein
MQSGEKCGVCRFYIEKKETIGECRRYAPRPNALKINWCKVGIDYWCGEFERKEPSKGTHTDQEQAKRETELRIDNLGSG